MGNKKLRILVSNDDGYSSYGFEVLCQLCSMYGDVVGIAPKEPQSGKSAAISIDKKLWLTKKKSTVCSNGNTITIFCFNGTPVDCVKIAMNTVFSIENKPDLLFSGINHGSNASTAAVYSGTLGAAKEGAIYSIPSVALSIDSHDPYPDFKGVKTYFPLIMSNLLHFPFSKGTFLNINFPDISVEKINGFKFSSQGKGMWINEFHSHRTEKNRKYYTMSGEFVSLEEHNDGDHSALKEGYISVSPQLINATDYEEMRRLAQLWSSDLK